MATNRPSNQDAPRVPGEEGGGAPWGKIIAALIGLLLLALLIPLACQAFRGTGDEDSGTQGAGEATEARDGGAQGTGGGGGAGGETTGPEEGAGAQSADREVTGDLAGIEGRSGDGTSVTIPSATISGADGWIAVHADDGGEPGEVLGYAPVWEGENTSVEVPLDEPLGSTQRLHAMLHVEDPADGDFTFPDGDPPVDAEGETVTEPFRYAVGDAASPEQARDEELPESGGISASVMVAIGAAMFLAGFALLRGMAARRD